MTVKVISMGCFLPPPRSKLSFGSYQVVEASLSRHYEGLDPEHCPSPPTDQPAPQSSA